MPAMTSQTPMTAKHIGASLRRQPSARLALRRVDGARRGSLYCRACRKPPPFPDPTPDVARRSPEVSSVARPGALVIEARSLSKRYGDVKAVDAVTFSVGQGRGGGLPRPERRRQDHHHAHADRLPAAHGRHRGDRRPRHLRRSARRAARRRIPARDPAAVPRDDGAAPICAYVARIKDVPRAQARRASSARSSAAGCKARSRQRDRHALEGLPPARRPRAGDRPRARRC